MNHFNQQVKGVTAAKATTIYTRVRVDLSIKNLSNFAQNFPTYTQVYTVLISFTRSLVAH